VVPFSGPQENVDVARKAPFSYWPVSTFRDGKTLRTEWFAERADALEAVRLRE
jgi:hypothetical protein